MAGSQKCVLSQTQVFKTQTFLIYIHVNYILTAPHYVLCPLGDMLFLFLPALEHVLSFIQNAFKSHVCISTSHKHVREQEAFLIPPGKRKLPHPS